MNPGAPTLQERLQAIAAHLHLAYSEAPLTRSDAFAAPMRRLYLLTSSNDKRPLPSVKQMCAGIKPDHAVEFIVVCPACGQMFDCREQAQVAHHSEEHHTPQRH